MTFPCSSISAPSDSICALTGPVAAQASRTDATSLCNELKKQGQTCFIRAMGGGETIQWAAKAGSMRLASR